MRIRDIARDDMTQAQRRVTDEAVSGKRGRMPAPLRAWIHSPELGQRAQKLGELLRYDTVLGSRLSELAILVTARFWTSRYEWFAHRSEALKAGLEPDIIEAIAAHSEPHFSDARSRVVYDYARQLHQTHEIPSDLHAAAVRELGDQGVVELVGLLGYYTLVAMTLNAFEIGLPAGAESELGP
ncbi:carboxymuconolactone decarboxylase family protein [Bradyrhizobium japonicum]|nr:carboxymuconolactone decarboxylase family protein [Bradyrhizobium japonicum]